MSILVPQTNRRGFNVDGRTLCDIAMIERKKNIRKTKFVLHRFAAGSPVSVNPSTVPAGAARRGPASWRRPASSSLSAVGMISRSSPHICARRCAAPERSTLPGASSMLRIFTTPSSTSIE